MMLLCMATSAFKTSCVTAHLNWAPGFLDKAQIRGGNQHWMLYNRNQPSPDVETEKLEGTE